MSGFIVIGFGPACSWSNDANPVDKEDVDLLAIAKECGLFAVASARGIADGDGYLHGDSWLMVVGDHIPKSELDFDPAVIAYCDLSEVKS